MKKVMLALAVSSFVMVSCAKNEVSETNINPNAIGFELGTGKTRASVANLDAVKAEGFTVYATNPAGTLIDSKVYEYANSKWGWAVSDIMWPTTDAGYPINFYAFYTPNISTGNGNITSALTKSFHINTNNAIQVDYLAANKLNVIAKPASGNITLDFKHILSKIDFKVITGAAVTVEVQSIAIRNAIGRGTFNLANMSWDTLSRVIDDFTYMVAPVVNDNIFVNQTTAKVVTAAGGVMMLMPQNNATYAWDLNAATIATNSYIEVVYRVYETATGKDIVGFTDATQHPEYATKGNGVTGPLFVKVGFSLDTNWLMSKGYSYTIYLGTPDGSGGNLTDENFEDKGGNHTGLPVVIDGEDKKITDPVVDTNKPIGFIVSVEDWTTATGINVK